MSGGLSYRIAQLMLLAYPPSFRRRYGDEVLAAFQEQVEEAFGPEALGQGGHQRPRWLRGFGLWKDLLVDWIRALTQAWGEAFRNKGRADQPRSVRDFKTRDLGQRRWVVESLVQDVVFGFRSLRRVPGFTAVAVLTLAVAIGANAVMFGVVNTVLLTPLPYAQPDQVVTLWSQFEGFPKTWVSDAEYRTHLTGARSFQDVATWSENNLNFTNPESAERVGGVMASENLTEVLGVDMAMGRFFTRDEARVTDSLPALTVVISHEAWTRRWNQNPNIIGMSTDVNGRAREIIGVLPAGFRLPTQFDRLDPADLYFPYFTSRDPVTEFPRNGGSHNNYVAARLNPGVTVAEARTDTEEVFRRRGNYDADRRFRPLVISADEEAYGSIRPAVLALLGTVALVLLIACANVANLMLARSEERASELAVRAALGADRSRLVAQLSVESLILGITGGVLGLGLAYFSVDLVRSLNPGNLPGLDQVQISGSVLATAAAITFGTVLLFGTLPALRSSAQALQSRMNRRATDGGRWQGALVAVQVALAVVLVVGAGLMLRTFGALTQIPTGFASESQITMALSLPGTRYPTAQDAEAFFRETLLEMERVPGVRSVSAIRRLPLAGDIGDWGLDVEGWDESINPPASGDWQIVSPGYFETMGIPLLSGRGPEWADAADAAPVAVVNQAFVDQYWPNQAPVGRQFVMSGTEVRVVGVVGNVLHNGLIEQVKPKFYIPFSQWNAVTNGRPNSLRFVVAGAGDATHLVEPLRDVIRQRDPSLAVAEVRTVNDIVAATVAQPRFTLILMAAFGAVAVFLASIGVYGVVAYGVRKRTREIGVRIALGARRDQVVSHMLSRGSRMVAIGLGLGAIISLGFGRSMEGLLYGVQSADPLTYLAVLVGFSLVAFIATWIPSNRAANVDPIQVLKAE